MIESHDCIYALVRFLLFVIKICVKQVSHIGDEFFISFFSLKVNVVKINRLSKEGFCRSF